jgi:hypothetical protein
MKEEAGYFIFLLCFCLGYWAAAGRQLELEVHSEPNARPETTHPTGARPCEIVFVSKEQMNTVVVKELK